MNRDGKIYEVSKWNWNNSEEESTETRSLKIVTPFVKRNHETSAHSTIFARHIQLH